ncbi:MAG TPA: NUDIX hydrolase [Thermohalobaculum sp.]|nr:NUDIX hydrolase [Thermohalobaculum sp.]
MNAPPKDAVRNAATVVVIRRDQDVPRVLMGQRGAGAAFMPSKFVFPGGAVDLGDAAVPVASPLAPRCRAQLERQAPAGLADALAMSAIRELWEETGLALSLPSGPRPANPPPAWQSFFAEGHHPAADALEFIFRAITPPGRPRRFDARFFLADASRVSGDASDFSRADSELSFLSWLTLAEARQLDLPFITGVVLAEIEARLAAPGDERPAPFFHHAGGRSFIEPL